MNYAQYIGARGNGKPYLVNSNGDTGDIIGAIMDADKQAARYTANLAPVLRGTDTYQTCANLWKFWKEHVRYQEDPEGHQYIKSPRELFHSGFGDCKSYSIAVASCLKNLGIPYVYRFTSETPGKEYHHVYIVAKTPQGPVIIDCVLDKFNYENPFVMNKDLAPARGAIGAPSQQITDVEWNWVKYVEDYKKNINYIKDNVRYSLKMGPLQKWGENSIKGSFMSTAIGKKFDVFINISVAMVYHFWDESKNGTFPIALNQKREFGAYVYDKLSRMGCRHEDLYNLCSLGVFNIYGIPLEYLFYRAKNMLQYGQPWTPKPGVPYWNMKTGVLNANGAALADTVKIASCFPVNGGIARPWGQPYWAVGGWLMSNGASQAQIDLLVKYNPQPATQNTATPAAQKAAIDLYQVWRRGQMPGLPIVTVGQGKPGMNGETTVYDMQTGKPVIGIGKAKIGDVATIVSAVAAVVVALGTIAGIVAKIINESTKTPSQGEIPSYPQDFNEMYTTVDGCTILQVAGGGYRKCCPNGQCQDNPNLNDPANHPAAGANAFASGGTGWLFIAGGVLLLLGLLWKGGGKANS